MDNGSIEKDIATETRHCEDVSRTPTSSRTPVLPDLHAPILTAEQQTRLWRKLDLRMLLILTTMFLFSFLDRGNIGNARLQGLPEQLHLVGNQYNIALTMYFIPYCLFECPSNLLLKRFRPSRWLPGITVAWGIIMTLMGLVKTYPQFVGTRVLLGVAESGLVPGVVYYLTLWYPPNKLQYRIGLFYGAATLAGAFSGLLAFGISFMSGTAGLLGWSWIFILEGIATVLVGLVSFFIILDSPASAKFLTREERAFIQYRTAYDGEDEEFSSRHVWEAFTDWQVLSLCLVYLSIVAPLYGITLFLPTIISSFGHSATVSQLLTVPPYAVGTLVILLFAHFSDKLGMRSPFILAGLLMCLVGFAINISDVSHGTKYFGTFLVVSGSYGVFPGAVAWSANNFSGRCKRAVGMALNTTIGNLAGAFASNIYRTQDGPRYILGHGVELMFVGIGLIVVPSMVWRYSMINRQRDEVARDASRKHSKKGGEVPCLHESLKGGDRAPNFRYTL